MRSLKQLTDEKVNHVDLDRRVRLAIAESGLTQKEWHKRWEETDDFPSQGTLYGYRRESKKRSKKIMAAVERAIGGRMSSDTDTDIATSSSVVLEENDLYAAINRIIEEMEGGAGQKRIWVGALFGAEQRRRHEEEETDPPEAWGAFVKLLTDRIKSPQWQVHILYNVPSRTRLAEIETRLQDARKAQSHVVKAFAIEGGAPLLCPLILGDHAAFLGISHQCYYRSTAALHLTAPHEVAFVKRYWFKLWNEATIIRKDAGLLPTNLKILRHQVARLERVAGGREGLQAARPISSRAGGSAKPHSATMRPAQKS